MDDGLDAVLYFHDRAEAFRRAAARASAAEASDLEELADFFDARAHALAFVRLPGHSDQGRV